MSCILIVSDASIGLILFFNCRLWKYFTWSGTRRLGGGLNVPINISSTLEDHPSFPMILFILSVVNSVPSAWDKWCTFLLMRIFSMICGSDSDFHCIESSLGILFQSLAFKGTSMVDRVDCTMGLELCLMVEWSCRWYSIVMSYWITFPCLNSPFNSRASARSDRCWRLKFVELAIVSLSFFRVMVLVLNALGIVK